MMESLWQGVSPRLPCEAAPFPWGAVGCPHPCGAHTILVAPTGRGATRTHCVLLGTRIFAAPGTVTADRQARVVGMVSHGSGRLSGFYGRC